VAEELKIGRRTVAISHPDKVLFPRAKLTKLDLARHYELGDMPHHVPNGR